MKTDTSMNVMLVVFCIVLIGFVLLNTRMADAMKKKVDEQKPLFNDTTKIRPLSRADFLFNPNSMILHFYIPSHAFQKNSFLFSGQ